MNFPKRRVRFSVLTAILSFIIIIFISFYLLGCFPPTGYSCQPNCIKVIIFQRKGAKNAEVFIYYYWIMAFHLYPYCFIKALKKQKRTQQDTLVYIA